MESRNDRVVISRQGQASIAEFTGSKLLEEMEINGVGETLTALAAEQSPPRLVLDFGNVKFMSSSALGVLISLHKQVRQKDGQLALCNVRPEIFEVFSITKLSQVFQIYDDRTAAVAGVG